MLSLIYCINYTNYIYTPKPVKQISKIYSLLKMLYNNFERSSTMTIENQGTNAAMHNYLEYLSFLEIKLQKFFEEQKPYIFCKKGCAKCCKNAEFPYSFAEIQYLMTGFLRLDDQTKLIISKNLTKIAEKKETFKGENGEKFYYDCPFLIDNSCSVYPYRGIVCRTFGLIANIEGENPKVPFCCNEGQNYSNVYDESTNQLSTKKVRELGFENEPVGYNISYEFLTNTDFEEKFNFRFGEKKPLLEWLE